MEKKINIFDGLKFDYVPKEPKVSLNESYLQIIYEISEERIGKNAIIANSDNEDKQISILFRNNKGMTYRITDILTENGYFVFEKRWFGEKIPKYRFNSLDMFRQYVEQIIENQCKPAIINLYKQNDTILPEKMEAPKINIDLSKITEKWITDTFKEISEDVLNGEYIENVKIEKNFTLPSGSTSGTEKFEDGVLITFNVWWNNWSEWMTTKHKYNIKINNKGLISVNLPEAIEGAGIESGLKKKIGNYIKV